MSWAASGSTGVLRREVPQGAVTHRAAGTEVPLRPCRTRPTDAVPADPWLRHPRLPGQPGRAGPSHRSKRRVEQVISGPGLIGRGAWVSRRELMQVHRLGVGRAGRPPGRGLRSCTRAPGAASGRSTRATGTRRCRLRCARRPAAPPPNTRSIRVSSGHQPAASTARAARMSAAGPARADLPLADHYAPLARAAAPPPPRNRELPSTDPCCHLLRTHPAQPGRGEPSARTG